MVLCANASPLIFEYWLSEASVPVSAFISYSHANAKSLDRLHKHLAMLERDGSLDAWTDHDILPGDKFEERIDGGLAKSQLFVALLSADYLASEYCYDKEFAYAQQRAAEGQLRIVPVIIEPCEWLSSPFAEYSALPKDGKAISEWSNQNAAYHGVVTGLRRVIEDIARTAGPGNDGNSPTTMVKANAGRRPRVKKDFDTIEKIDFADQAYEVIRDYFQNSCRELTDVGEGSIKAKFERMSDTAFTCTVVNRDKKRGGEGHITVRNGKGGRRAFGDISYVFQRYADDGSSNGSISVENDDYNMYLTLNNFHREAEKLSSQQAAEALWSEFVQQAGIEYD